MLAKPVPGRSRPWPANFRESSRVFRGARVLKVMSTRAWILSDTTRTAAYNSFVCAGIQARIGLTRQHARNANAATIASVYAGLCLSHQLVRVPFSGESVPVRTLCK
jgi:hypothetical protein